MYQTWHSFCSKLLKVASEIPQNRWNSLVISFAGGLWLCVIAADVCLVHLQMIYACLICRCTSWRHWQVLWPWTPVVHNESRDLYSLYFSHPWHPPKRSCCLQRPCPALLPDAETGEAVCPGKAKRQSPTQLQWLTTHSARQRRCNGQLSTREHAL